MLPDCPRVTADPVIDVHAPDAPGVARTPVSSRAATRDVGVQIVGRALNLALGIAVTALLARTLGDTGYGQWATIFAVLGILTQLTSLGLTGVAVRQAATDPGREAAWVGALLTVQASLCVLMVPIGGVVLVLLADTPAMRIAGLVLLGTVLLAAPNSLRAIFQLRMRNGIPVAVTTLNSVLWAAAVVVLALAEGALTAFAAAFLVVAVLTSAVEAIAALRLTGPLLRGTRHLWGELLRIGIPLGVGTLLITAYARIDQILVFEIAGAREAGLYGAAYRILDQAHFVPLSIITTIAPLTAASAARDPERLWRIVSLAARVLLVISLGALALALVASRPAMVLIFGPDFAEAAAALPVLAAAFVAMCLGYLAGNLVLVFRLQRRFVVLAALGLAFNVGLNLLLIPRYGYIAAAWTTLATELLVVGPTLAFGLRRLPRALPWLDYGRVAVAATGLGAALWGLVEIGVPVLVAVVLAAPLYLGLLLATGAARREELDLAFAAIARRSG